MTRASWPSRRPAPTVEYLFQRGELRIANLEDVTRENNPVIRYEARRGA
jgi:hypothetical protein